MLALSGRQSYNDSEVPRATDSTQEAFIADGAREQGLFSERQATLGQLYIRGTALKHPSHSETSHHSSLGALGIWACLDTPKPGSDPGGPQWAPLLADNVVGEGCTTCW